MIAAARASASFSSISARNVTDMRHVLEDVDEVLCIIAPTIEYEDCKDAISFHPRHHLAGVSALASVHLDHRS